MSIEAVGGGFFLCLGEVEVVRDYLRDITGRTEKPLCRNDNYI